MKNVKFQFIHTYLPGTFEALTKSGLYRPGDGLKVMHKNYLEPARRFNVLCAPDSPLFRLVKALDCPFYVDRYQGGIPMPYLYDYDPDCIRSFLETLGDNFWGFQIHEWASNYRSESDRVRKAIETFRTEKPGVSLSEFWREKIEAAKTNPGALYVEANAPSEWQNMSLPETPAAFLSGIRALWERRRTVLHGAPMIPADSFFMSHKITAAGGAKRLMPEIGWQIPHARIQLAYTRGMARAAGIPFGVYYECWCSQNGRPLTVPYAADSVCNEWYEDNLLSDVAIRTDGNPRNGGSSRSLQSRAWTMSYFQGASFMGEEYGLCNTFDNYRDGPLSAYGRVKKDFLDLTDEYPDLGEPFTPFAVVLPKNMDILTIGEGEETYLQYPLSMYEPSFATAVTKARRTLETLLSDKDSGSVRMGSDPHVFQNGLYPDVFDIIHADSAPAFDRYPYLIDCTGDAAFAGKYADRIVPVDGVRSVLDGLLPVKVTGGPEVACNRTADGWRLLLMNNNGVDRTPKDGDVLLPEATLTAEILPGTVKDPERLHRLAGAGNCVLSADAGHVTLTMPAGSWILLAL